MAINPQIPLMAQPQINPLPGIDRLAGAMQYRDEKELAQSKAKSDARLKNIQTHKLLLEIDSLGKTRSLNDHARAVVGVKSLLDSGENEAALEYALQHRAMLQGRIDEGEDVNTIQTDQFIKAMQQNPEQAGQIIEGEMRGLAQLGAISRDESGNPFAKVTKIFKNGVVMQAGGSGEQIVTRQDGTQAKTPEEREEVLQAAYRSENSKLKTDEEVNQILEIEKAKQSIRTDDEVRRLQIESLQSQIDQGQLKVQEGTEQKEKAAAVKQDMQRIVDKLLDNSAGVRNFVGPVDQWTPTLYKESLQARTDIEQLKSILTSQNLGIMSGVLSETDLKVIAAIAGGGLDVTGSDDAFVEELKRMKQSFAGGGSSGGSTGKSPRIRYDAQGNRIQ